MGGRLANANLPFENKHPILLHPDDKITKWFVKEAHMITMHGNIQSMLSLLRLRYWIIQGRYAVKGFIKICYTCCRWNKVGRTQLMGDLLFFRVVSSKPFKRSGVDYAGPFKIRLSKCRGNNTLKGYIAVFVCFVTHAVHLEVVEEYSVGYRSRLLSPLSTTWSGLLAIKY